MTDSILTPSDSPKPIRAVTVFCGSSDKADPNFAHAAADLGRAIGNAGWTLVYGGNRIGLMGILADAVRQSGARVVGITPQFFLDKGLGDDRCDSLIATANLRDRKALMEQHGDAFVALPGGLGTLDEIFDVLVSRALGFHEKPIVLLNIANFYDPLLTLLDHAIEHHFIKPRMRNILHVATTVDHAMQFLKW